MGLLIAPYNTAMRHVGQGFNSYTQEICIDDAVVIDPGRPFNTLTNDGSTMMDFRNGMKGESPYSAVRDLSPTERELLGIAEEADTAHDADPEIRAEPELEAEPMAKKDQILPVDSGTKSKQEPKLALKSAGDDGRDGGNSNSGEMTRGVNSSTHTNDDANNKKTAENNDNIDTALEGKESDNNVDASGDETTVVKETPKPAPRKKEEAKPSLVPKSKKPTKEERTAARKEAAFKKKREDDDEKQAAERKEAETKANQRAEEADKRARAAASGVRAYTKAERDALLKDLTNDVTDDMNISGALSIKYGNIGGSGRGAFVNTEKFKDSDLNFYISVKVVNQTINMKDALVYQPLRTVDSNNFREVYGDSFISGFIEGGEFNAIVSMKVHNKAQLMNIEAEAKVAMTVGVADISAEAAVKVAKKNISNNTETTIMVSWSGGGYIKPIDEPWDIESLMSAAARFPDLVAITPQRTYAILTKYETLRSFVKLKPAAFSPMAYENAQMYTNTLLDVYMDYKNLHKKLGSWIFDVENNISGLQANSAWKKKDGNNNIDDGGEHGDDDDSNEQKKQKKGIKREDTTTSYQALAITGSTHDRSRFPISLGGLDIAKKACRIQMTRIVNEVDAITKDPSLATIEGRPEPFMPVRLFKEHLPAVIRIVKPPAVPLRLEELKPGFDRQYPQLCPDFDTLEEAERLSLTELERERPTIGRFFRLAKPVGSAKTGTPFNNVDFLRFDTHITDVHVEVYKGVVSYIEVKYSNGLLARHGGQYDSNATKYFKLKGLGRHERIIAAAVETGKSGMPEPDKPKEKIDTSPVEPRITRLKLYTNRGRKLAAQAIIAVLAPLMSWTSRIDPIMDNSFVKGFWGYSKNGLNGMLEDGIWRLGIIWGNNLTPEVPPTGDSSTDNKKIGNP
ncbi:hypothetical protein NUW58_g1543 [Xylaria curta]|uniref:Uncharacterized protein n=1 Tax=Xylaria curta TaxID=42375 RepID=A0ACC1PL41_9PEZI|nr:hypothetical protein NUW58_g1543 [Xylaria curta]